MNPQHSIVENPVKVAMMVIGFTLLFTVMSTLVKLAAQDGLPIFTIMFWRYAFGGVPVTIFLLTQKNLKGSLFHSEWKGLTSRAAMGVVAMWCTFTSISMLPLAEATTLHFAAPFIMTLISIIVMKEHVGIWRWGAIIAGFIGVLFILRPDFSGAMAGQIIALCAATIMALNMTMIRTMASRVSSEAMTLYVHLVGVVCLLPLAIHDAYLLSLTDWLYVAALGLAAGVAQLLLNHAYLNAPAPYVSAFSYIQIIFVTIAGYLVFHTVPTHTFLIGAGIIVASGLTIIIRETLLKKKIPVKPIA